MTSWVAAINAAVAKAFGNNSDPVESRSPRSKMLGQAMKAMQVRP